MVYFVRDEVSDLIKIGFSRNVGQRFEHLRSSFPNPLILMTAAEGTKRDEGLLHKRFAADRRQGEWFSASLELREFISAVLATGSLWPEGDPVHPLMRIKDAERNRITVQVQPEPPPSGDPEEDARIWATSYTAHQAASLLFCDVNTVYWWIRKGQIPILPPLLARRPLRIAADVVERLVAAARLRQEGPSEHKGRRSIPSLLDQQAVVLEEPGVLSGSALPENPPPPCDSPAIAESALLAPVDESAVVRVLREQFAELLTRHEGALARLGGWEARVDALSKAVNALHAASWCARRSDLPPPVVMRTQAQPLVPEPLSSPSPSAGRWLTRTEAVEHFGRAERTIRHWLAEGRLHGYQVQEKGYVSWRIWSVEGEKGPLIDR